MGPFAKSFINGIIAAGAAYAAVISTGGTKAQATSAAITAMLANLAGLWQTKPTI